MAFAKQKLEEVALLARAVDGREVIREALAENMRVMESRRTSSRVHNEELGRRIRSVDISMNSRKNPYPVRRLRQAEACPFPYYLQRRLVPFRRHLKSGRCERPFAMERSTCRLTSISRRRDGALYSFSGRSWPRCFGTWRI